MFLPNDVIEYLDTPGRPLRILWIDPAGAQAYTYALGIPGAVPRPASLRDLYAALGARRARLLRPDPWRAVSPATAPSDSQRRYQLKAWNVVRALHQDLPALYLPRERATMLAACGVEHGIAPASIMRYLRRYWERGQTLDALLPDYANSGARGRTREARGAWRQYRRRAVRLRRCDQCAGGDGGDPRQRQRARHDRGPDRDQHLLERGQYAQPRHGGGGHHDSNYGSHGRVDWSAAANYNHVGVIKINQAPPEVQPQTLLDETAISHLKTASPRMRVNLGALWKVGAWTVNLRENYLGRSSEQFSSDGSAYHENKIKPKLLTDLEVSYQFSKEWTLSLGANKLFNKYPDMVNCSFKLTQS